MPPSDQIIMSGDPEPNRNGIYLDSQGGRWTFEDDLWTWRSADPDSPSHANGPLRMWSSWAAVTGLLAAFHWPWRVADE